MTNQGSRQCCDCTRIFFYDRDVFEPPGDEGEDGFVCDDCEKILRNRPIKRKPKKAVWIDKLSPEKRALWEVLQRVR